MATKKRKRRYIPPANEVKHLDEGGDGGRSRDTHVRTIQASKPASGGARGAGTNTLEEPSIRRTIKRLPIYFALIFALQFYLVGVDKPDYDTVQRAIAAGTQAGIVTLAFSPFMHIMDRWTYNRLQRKAAESAAPRKPGTRA